MNSYFDGNMMKPFTDEEIERLAIDVLSDVAVAFDFKALRDHGEYRPLLLPGTHVPRKLSFLLASAPAMYQELGRVFQAMQLMVDNLEITEANHRKANAIAYADMFKTSIDWLTAIQNQILVSRRIATEGPEKVAAELYQHNRKKKD